MKISEQQIQQNIDGMQLDPSMRSAILQETLGGTPTPVKKENEETLIEKRKRLIIELREVNKLLGSSDSGQSESVPMIKENSSASSYTSGDHNNVGNSSIPTLLEQVLKIKAEEDNSSKELLEEMRKNCTQNVNTDIIAGILGK